MHAEALQRYSAPRDEGLGRAVALAIALHVAIALVFVLASFFSWQHDTTSAAGLPVMEGYVITSDFEFGGGFSAMQKLLALPERPQAVFVGNDAMAVGAYQSLYQAGLRIPQDMALVGYDDIELARYMTPPLTTIHQPKDELGELAIDVLIHRMADPGQKQQRVQLTPELVVRGSV